MGGMQAVELLVRFRLQPSIKYMATREYECMNAVDANHSQLKLAIE